MEAVTGLVGFAGVLAVIALVVAFVRKSTEREWRKMGDALGLSFVGDTSEPALAGTYEGRKVRVLRQKTERSIHEGAERKGGVTVLFETPLETPLSEDILLFDVPSEAGMLAEMVIETIFPASSMEVGHEEFDANLGIAGGAGIDDKRMYGPFQMLEEFGSIEEPEKLREYFGGQPVASAFLDLQRETSAWTCAYLVDAREGKLKLMQLENYDSLPNAIQNLDALVTCADRLEEARSPAPERRGAGGAETDSGGETSADRNPSERGSDGDPMSQEW